VRGLIRIFVAVSAVAAGSYLSLHRDAGAPSSSQPLTSSSSTSASTSPLPEPAASPADNEAPDPSQTPAVPATVSWPHLNPEANLMKAWRLAEGPHRAPNDKKKLVTLTFDDGPFPETTPRVLDLLAQHNVHATFFVIGRYLDG